jgi:hypothetical protein
MGKRFIVVTLSSYPLCKKTSGWWERILKPQTFLLRDIDGFTASFQDCKKTISNTR